MPNSYDLIVLGAGPGGYVAAIKASQLGARVALVEPREVGGTCLNRGCIPTKTFIHAAQALDKLSYFGRLGISFEKPVLSMEALHNEKDQVIATLRSGIESLLRANKIERIHGKGIVQSARTVRVGEEMYEAKYILIATGSVPSVPNIPGLDLPHVVTSDDLLQTGSKRYERLCVVGGGVIGVEFAGIYHTLGSEITIVEYMGRILPQLDKEISQSLAMSMKKRGISILTNTALERVEENGGALRLTVRTREGLREVDADGVLVSTGRKANTDGLLAGDMDLSMQRGQIPVDENFQTCIEGVYAVGDVVLGGVQLAHAASAQGIRAACAMFSGGPSHDLRVIPSCIYTKPEAASVGMTADEAKEAGIPVKIGKYLMSGNGKSILSQSERGFIKLVFREDTGVLVGAQMLCDRATDMISGLAAAIVNGLTGEELMRTVFPHPTFCEGISEAAEDAFGQGIHTPPKRRP